MLAASMELARSSSGAGRKRPQTGAADVAGIGLNRLLLELGDSETHDL